MKNTVRQCMNSALGGRERKVTGRMTLVRYVWRTVEQMDAVNKKRTKEIYLTALRSFMEFRQGKDIALDGLDSDMILKYESYLLDVRGISRNSSSFYMRALRALYNRAVDAGVVADCCPFKHVYTGVDRTVKRALPLKSIKRIMNLDLSDRPRSAFARDLFMFSFYTRGMSFVDMAYLRKSDLGNGVLTYRRRKTGQLLQIRWEKCMQAIIERYGNGADGYLLPIITKEGCDARQQYLGAICATNVFLKEVGAMAGISQPLTTYVARHSWASIAKQKNVPLSVISEGMGHDNEKTTRIYLATLESSAVDKANSTVIKALMG